MGDKLNECGFLARIILAVMCAFQVVRSPLAVKALQATRSTTRRPPNLPFINRFQRGITGNNLNEIIHGSSRKKIIYQASASSRGLTTILMMAADDDENIDSEKSLESNWNMAGLRKEVDRLVLRCHKKIGKASNRLAKAQKEVDRLTSNEDVTMEELEKCPNIDAIELECEELRNRLGKLNTLEELLRSIKGNKSMILPEGIAVLALDLGVDDHPPVRKPRPPKKPKGPKTLPPRLPYRKYYSKDNVEIRVGKRAEDNDELSLSPKHRDGSDWWMHASGCPGSHVVIRSGEEKLDNDVIQDAAALAAKQSKCSGSIIKVSLTRCRDIKKPPGAKAGLVMITGSVRTIKVDMKKAEALLERLDQTLVVN